MSDVATASDVRRMEKARRQAQLRYAEIQATRDAQAAVAFRAELSDVVRSASPLLISLLAIDGLTLDAAVALIDPAQSWPHQPRLSGRSFKHSAHNHLLRYYIARLPPDQRAKPPSHEHTFHRINGNWVTMKVVDHLLEPEARIAPVWLETRCGELRVQLDEALPETLATAAVGRLVEEIVDHVAWRGRGWRILATEEPVASYFGQTLIIATGSVPYRIAWPQPAVSEGR
ncbi:hypothetical protein [Sphingomonas antarctica]|uniref:hypothetical protein n=1 Tax=Sphingomonas antarctica TaxID=2040274 RepID=UPI0039EACE4C